MTMMEVLRVRTAWQVQQADHGGMKALPTTVSSVQAFWLDKRPSMSADTGPIPFLIFSSYLPGPWHWVTMGSGWSLHLRNGTLLCSCWCPNDGTWLAAAAGWGVWRIWTSLSFRLKSVIWSPNRNNMKSSAVIFDAYGDDNRCGWTAGRHIEDECEQI